MAQTPRPLTPQRSAKDLFGAELRHWRQQRGLSQHELGQQVFTSGARIGKIEKGDRWPTADLAAACDTILDTGGILSRLLPLVEQQRSSQPQSATDPFGFAETMRATWPGTTISRGSGDIHGLALPGGRWMSGTTIPIRVHPASPAPAGTDTIVITDTARLAGRPGRILVIGTERTPASPRFYVLDAHTHTPGQRHLRIPAAYHLDDLTYAIIWATANLDDALLADDQTLTEARRHARPYERLPTSAVSRDLATDLTQVSRSWLGSDFCARHILRALPTLAEHPVFWTSEQRGEEASAWLLFRHKYAYLQATHRRAGGSPSVRAFCVPEDVVTHSPAFERVLFILAAALMESFDITVRVCIEPDLAAIEGFALAPGRQAIIANWVRSAGIWHVDTTSRPHVITSFTDAHHHAEAHSILPAGTSGARMIALADYLRLDWPWLRQRCAALATHGITGLTRPRSRLLSTAGLDRACRYLGRLNQS